MYPVDKKDVDFISEYSTVYEKLYELRRESPFMKALVKNLPNLKINEGGFPEIASPNPTYPSKDSLWEIQCKPTGDFDGF